MQKGELVPRDTDPNV